MVTTRFSRYTGNRLLAFVLNPGPIIQLDGSWAGTTPYGVTYDGTVELIAPFSQVLNAGFCTFIRWEVDGVPQPDLQRSISATMPPDHAAMAIYQITQPQLHVSSTPITGISISGDKPGTTPYAASCAPGEPLNLQAPETVTVGGVQYRFVRWNLNDDVRNHPAPAISFDVDWDVDATALYTDQEPTVVVSSSPCSGASIAGSRPGTTTYTIAGSYLEDVTLLAPPSIVWAGGPRAFMRWTVDGFPMSQREMTARITLRGAHTALAVYGGVVLRIQGPAGRGEPPLPPGKGTFTVDLFLSNAGPFAGFEATALQFLDTSAHDAGSSIVKGAGGNPAFEDLHIALNDARWPSIFPIYLPDQMNPSYRKLFGFLSMQDSSVTEETWLCTVTYEYGAADEGTYSIASDPVGTLIINSAGIIQHYELPGTVTIALAADLNGDCVVNLGDLLALRDLLGQRGSPGIRGDLNVDGVINTLDLIILRNKMGKTCR